MEEDKKSREATIHKSLKDIIGKNDPEQVIQGLDILHKLISNILKNPTDEKFRILKKSNKTIQAKLLSLNPYDSVISLLTALGYVEMDGDISAFVGNYFSILNHGAMLIEDECMQLKMMFMTDEERKK